MTPLFTVSLSLSPCYPYRFLTVRASSIWVLHLFSSVLVLGKPRKKFPDLNWMFERSWSSAIGLILPSAHLPVSCMFRENKPSGGLLCIKVLYRFTHDSVTRFYYHTCQFEKKFLKSFISVNSVFLNGDTLSQSMTHAEAFKTIVLCVVCFKGCTHTIIWIDICKIRLNTACSQNEVWTMKNTPPVIILN